MNDTSNSSSFVWGALVVLILFVLGTGVFFLSQKNSSSTSQSQNTSNQTSLPTQTPNTAPTATNINPHNSNITLNISQPQDGSVVNTPTIKIAGTTVPNADVSINDQDLTADNEGKFMTSVTLEEGDNYIDIVANDQNGQSNQKELLITYQTTP